MGKSKSPRRRGLQAGSSRPPADAKASIESAFNKIGGVDGLSRWALSHKAMFYSTIYPKLIALPPSAVTQVNVNTVEDAAERAQFKQTLENVIAARAQSIVEQNAGIKRLFVGGPNIDREIRASVKAERELRAAMAEPATAENSAVDSPSDVTPATPEPAPEPVVPTPEPATPDPPNIVRLKEFTPREPDATQLFYERGGYGASERIRPEDWGPV